MTETTLLFFVLLVYVGAVRAAGGSNTTTTTTTTQDPFYSTFNTSCGLLFNATNREDFKDVQMGIVLVDCKDHYAFANFTDTTSDYINATACESLD